MMFLEKMRRFFSIFPVISASKPMKKLQFRVAVLQAHASHTCSGKAAARAFPLGNFS